MAAPPAVLTQLWPLTGRHEDLEAVLGALADGSRAEVIVGEAGTGKTRLAREVLRRLGEEGVPTAGATASESAAATPLGALAHLVPAGALDSPPTVFAATRAAIEAQTGGRSLVLHVDDAHLLDPSSAALLMALAEAGVVQLVLTMRPGRRGPDALAALRAADGVTTRTLGALDPIAIDTLLHRVLGGPLDGVAEAQLLHTSGGNPLYLRELVLGAVQDGSLREVDGVWRLDGAFPAAEALGDRVLGRMSELPGPEREALELVAVGEPIGLDLLETLVDADVLEGLEERGLLRVETDQRRHEVRLAHPVYGEILRGGIGRVRLRRLSRSLVEAVTATGLRRADDAARLVRWQIDAGLAPEPEVVMAGARLARHHLDWITVVRMGRAALDAGHIEAAALLVEAHFELGEFDEVEAVTALALARSDELDDDPLAEVHRIHASLLMWGRDDSDAAVAHIEGALERAWSPAALGVLRFTLAEMYAWVGRVDDALAVAEPLLEGDDETAAVQAATIVELLAATCGPAGRTVELADRWFPVHFGLADRVGTTNPGNHLITKTVALTHIGRLGEAAELADAVYGVAVSTSSLIGQMWCSLELGRNALARGDALTARRWFREYVALCRGTGHGRPLALGLAGLATAEAHLGDGAAAAKAIDDLRAHGRDVVELLRVDQARGEAWALAANGAPADARAALVAAADAADELGIHLSAALARVDALRLGDRGQAAALARAAATVDSRLVELAARWAGAPEDPEVLEEVGRSYEALGALMHGAEVLAAAAEAWKRRGEQRRATAVQHDADELARRCRGTATPALAVAETVVPLTAREREIAVLVAEGLSSKEVAERLYVSARTVSNHLQNAYAKLGISKRTELAAALRRLGDDPEGSP